MAHHANRHSSGAGRARTSLRRAFSALARLCLCVIFVALTACSNTVNLQTGLNDSDANEIVSILSRNGIEAKKHAGKDGVTLTVKDSDISRATDVMQQAGLPRRSLSSLGQVFKKEGMISTPLEERVRYIHGLSQELESTLLQFDNVVSARVHVVLPERIAPGEPIQPSSAAVFVKYRPPFDEDTNIPRIRHLVASSIPGLSGEEGIDKVSVVLAQTENLGQAVEWITVGPFNVQTSSANALIGTLLGLAVLAACSLAAALWLLVMHNPKAIAAIRQRFGKPPAFVAPDENEKLRQAAGKHDVS
ncbi:type III secretion system inner membrane ring lipoprotein SctJ [Collimonas humicola]|uniref:type III secretion system inner membrane ring lipoprotein SctJ n=1 Tax=Collimonas humicola TaxID=2825886 RepID=UPI001B8C3B78|nr:type III secretion inner membrane ring lipoprotein SctJ [Collimonas humicola]